MGSFGALANPTRHPYLATAYQPEQRAPVILFHITRSDWPQVIENLDKGEPVKSSLVIF